MRASRITLWGALLLSTGVLYGEEPVEEEAPLVLPKVEGGVVPHGVAEPLTHLLVTVDGWGRIRFDPASAALGSEKHLRRLGLQEGERVVLLKHLGAYLSDARRVYDVLREEQGLSGSYRTPGNTVQASLLPLVFRAHEGAPWWHVHSLRIWAMEHGFLRSWILVNQHDEQRWVRLHLPQPSFSTDPESPLLKLPKQRKVIGIRGRKRRERPYGPPHRRTVVDAPRDVSLKIGEVEVSSLAQLGELLGDWAAPVADPASDLEVVLRIDRDVPVRHVVDVLALIRSMSIERVVFTDPVVPSSLPAATSPLAWPAVPDPEEAGGEAASLLGPVAVPELEPSRMWDRPHQHAFPQAPNAQPRPEDHPCLVVTVDAWGQVRYDPAQAGFGDEYYVFQNQLVQGEIVTTLHDLRDELERARSRYGLICNWAGRSGHNRAPGDAACSPLNLVFRIDRSVPWVHFQHLYTVTRGQDSYKRWILVEENGTSGYVPAYGRAPPTWSARRPPPRLLQPLVTALVWVRAVETHAVRRGPPGREVEIQVPSQVVFHARDFIADTAEALVAHLGRLSLRWERPHHVFRAELSVGPNVPLEEVVSLVAGLRELGIDVAPLKTFESPSRRVAHARSLYEHSPIRSEGDGSD